MKVLSQDNLTKVFKVVKGWIDTAKSALTTEINKKANSADVYTKTQVNTELGKKANSADVYTKTETAQQISSYATTNKLITESQAKALVQQIVDGAPEAYDTLKELAMAIDNDDSAAAGIIQQIAALRTSLGQKVNSSTFMSELGKKANSADVYPKTQTYTRGEIDDKPDTKLNSSDITALTDAEIDTIAASALAS